MEKETTQLPMLECSAIPAYRKLSKEEIDALVAQRNSAEDWELIHVKEGFDPTLIRDNEFFGINYIGITKASVLKHHDLQLTCGIYHSYLSGCTIHDETVVRNVKYLHGYTIGSGVILFNIEEMMLTAFPKFGYGVKQDKEAESERIALEICNENGGRQILPFENMQPGDAFLWSRFRDDKKLLEKFTQFTDQLFIEKEASRRVHISTGTVIKNCGIIKDVSVGEYAYIKGASKLKNLSINSTKGAPSQIGEGCELVNGIIAEGCRIFYGVKAVRFVMASHSSLKYGARLINSYLGNNSTVSCCEVLNSLIYPGHEQHHNNSFLCAALVMGQSNMAAGATIGSNHNSRSPDGELVADRGFWPGLSVTLKHNSVFSAYNLVAKGNYPYELNNPFPFALIVNDEKENILRILPGYWFIHNLYALARNSWKLKDRDKRTEKVQRIEYDFLAPDTVSQIQKSMELMERATEESYTLFYTGINHSFQPGAQLLSNGAVNQFKVVIRNIENSSRETQIMKPAKAYQVYKEMINLFCAETFLKHSIDKVRTSILNAVVYHEPEWLNVGGQLLSTVQVDKFRRLVHDGDITSWEEVHKHYEKLGSEYEEEILNYAAHLYIKNIAVSNTDTDLRKLIIKAINTREWMTEQVYYSRAKDYNNRFRKNVYRNEEEMDAVLGRLSDNSFISQTREELQTFKYKAISWMDNI